MLTVVGVFQTAPAARQAAAELKALGLKKDALSVLMPGNHPDAAKEIPTVEGEQPGMGPAVGGVVGGAVGVAGGVTLSEAAASIFVPGIGPVLAIGILGAAIFGAAGATGGALIGKALEEELSEGLPVDEIYVYEDALRKGRSVVAVLANDEEQAQAARAILIENGAESIDAAREQWWIGLRDAEREHYLQEGFDFTADEANYRRGFEAAQDPKARDKSYTSIEQYLARRYPDSYREAAFRRGYERGQSHHKGMSEKSRRALAQEPNGRSARNSK